MLKSILMVSAAALLVSAGPAMRQQKVSAPLAGDYVEARTASVFAGACHYNGEYMSCGRDAVAAWHIASGSWHGVDLSGVNMIAAVTSSANLADNLPRTGEVAIDEAATPAQRQAALSLFREKYASAFGSITAVHYQPVVFQHDGSQYTVQSPGFASMSVESMPNDECCKQPSLVWYNPLVELKGRKVGYTHNVEYASGKIGDVWQESDENSAFYGPLAF